MTRTRLSHALVFIALAAALSAFAKPNFTGDWKLNISKSTFGQMPAPSSLTSKITHDEPKLKSVTKSSSDQGDFDFEANYTTDGKECTNEMFGSPVKSVLKWDGETLIIDSKAQFGDNEFTLVDKWTLSADGKIMTIVRAFKSPMGEGEQKLVFEKQ